MKRVLTAFVLGLVVSACNIGPNTRVNSYRTFGQFQPAESERVSKEYNESLRQPTPDWNVTILNSSLPPGMALVNGNLLVSPDAPYEVLGSFELGFRLDRSAPMQSELPAYLKRFAKAARADVIVVIEIQGQQDQPQRVGVVTGLALHSKKGASAQPSTHEPVPAAGETTL